MASCHSLARANQCIVFAEMKRYHAEDPFGSDEEDFDQAMAREVEGFDYLSDDSDFEHAMVRSLDREEQLGGALGPLFHFRMQPVGRHRRP